MSTQLALRRNDLRHFDLLPKRLRNFLNETNHKFSSEAVHRMLQRGVSQKEIIKWIRRDDGQ